MSSPNPSLLSLPDDLLLSCVARISRLYYPTLSLVSKRFRSLLVSPEFYKVRSLLGHTESCLYVCLNFYSGGYRWFTLCRKPDDQIRTNDTKSSRYVLARVPGPHSPRTHLWSISVGSDIYKIDVSEYSSTVSILDCKSHTWLEGPSLPVKLLSCYGCVVDRKIYVAGIQSYWDQNLYPYKNLFGVLDTKTQTWDLMHPCKEILWDHIYRSACFDGKFYLKMGHEKVFAYDTKKDKWDRAEPTMGKDMFSQSCFSRSCCEIENVLYSFYFGMFYWYDTEVKLWRELKGLDRLVDERSCFSVTLADYGGKMAVTWVTGMFNERTIWCAEILLERRSTSCEIWGKVEWFGHVLRVPILCSLMTVLFFFGTKFKIILPKRGYR